jgi:glycosyltransferase involved in cell wall biosynthesis
MKIGFDGKRAVRNHTGLGNYSRYIVEILSENFKENNYILFAPEERSDKRLETLKSMDNVSFFFPEGIWKKLSSLWRVFRMGKDLERKNIDIFHGLSNELPVGIRKTGILSLVSLHDLIFLRYPEYYKLIDRKIYTWKFGYACRKADRIIAISECTKRDIMSCFAIPEEKIAVVYQGCHPVFREIIPVYKKEEVIKKYALPDDFILYVGSIESRKNLLLIVKALQMLDCRIQLVAVGKRTPYQTEVERYISNSGLSGRVYIYNRVPFDDLPAFYQLSTIFVYPSFFEGFGIPVVEALSSGVPVIATTGSCLEEAGGPDSLYVSPTDEQALASCIRKIWENPDLAQDMIRKGKQYVQRFSEERIAADLMREYRLALSERKNGMKK